jgi:hypothetical protein
MAWANFRVTDDTPANLFGYRTLATASAVLTVGSLLKRIIDGAKLRLKFNINIGIRLGNRRHILTRISAKLRY